MNARGFGAPITDDTQPDAGPTAPAQLSGFHRNVRASRS
jgi:hypothetical protein